MDPEPIITIPQPSPVPPQPNHYIFAHIGFMLLFLAGLLYAPMPYYQVESGRWVTNPSIMQSMIAAYSQSNTASSTQQEVSPAPSPTPDPTANWKTYTNTSSHYEIKYPPTWKIENQAAGSFGNEPPTNARFIEIFKPQTDPTISTGNIGFEEVNILPPGEEVLLTQQKIINGQTLKCQGSEGINSKLWCWIKVPNQNKYLNIHIFTNIDEEINQTFTQILSTFKFTQPTLKAQIPGWKYYTVPEFTFQYPYEWNLVTNKIIGDEALGISIRTFWNGDPMMNECMNLDSTKITGELMVQSFTTIQTGEMCGEQNSIKGEMWITRASGDGYGPGISYVYETTQPKAISIFNQILSTFKFTDKVPATPTCTPRPACLDSTPRCMIAETEDMCPKSGAF